MRKVIVVLGLFILSYSTQASSGGVENNFNLELEEIREDVNPMHPKRKDYRGNVVTSANYVKTRNPRRLHWNEIREKENSVGTNVKNRCPKRTQLLRTLSLKNKAGNIKGNFHKQRRRK